MTESKLYELTGIKLAKEANRIKQSIKNSFFSEGRAANRKDILALLELAGANIVIEKSEIMIEQGVNGNGNPFKRYTKPSTNIKIEFEGEKTSFETSESYFNMNFISWIYNFCYEKINVIELTKKRNKEV